MIFDLRLIHNLCKIRGVIHIGGFIGEEVVSYKELEIQNAVFFEPQPDIFEELYKNISKNNMSYIAHNIALGASTFEADMYVSSRQGGMYNGSGASSSLLRPYRHLLEHPEVAFTSKIKVPVKPLDEFRFYETGLYNMLNVDVQGYELEVLKGATETLETIDIIICEVNRDEVYEKCARIEDIVEYLDRFRFDLVSIIWQSKSWGDALFMRRN